MVLLGSECGILYRLPDSASISHSDRGSESLLCFKYFVLAIQCRQSCFICQIGNGLDALCVSTLHFFIPWMESVWSISAWPREDVIVLGSTYNGIVVVWLDRET